LEKSLGRLLLVSYCYIHIFSLPLALLFIAMVIEGENTLKSLYKGYGDIPPFGRGPDQQKIHNQGNAYIHRNFPKIDFINSCELVYSPKEKFVVSEPVQEQQQEESLQEGEETVVVEEVAKEEEQPPPEDQEELEKEEVRN